MTQMNPINDTNSYIDMEDHLAMDHLDRMSADENFGAIEIPISDLDDDDLDLVRDDFGLGFKGFAEENDDGDWLVQRMERWGDR